MRLLTEEYKEILKVADHFGLQFTLVKRKGWIHIEVNGKAFVFRRNEMTRLTNGKFVESIHYFIRIEGTAQQAVDNFQEVAQKLHEWLGKQ